MLVDGYRHLPAPTMASTLNDWDIGEIFHTDLFNGNPGAHASSSRDVNVNNNSIAGNSSPNLSSTPGLTSPAMTMSSNMSSASSPSSREATPLATPPSQSLGERFPDLAAGAGAGSSNLSAPHTSIAMGMDDGADDLFGGYFDHPAAGGDMMMGFTGVKGGAGFDGPGIPPSFGMNDDAFGNYMTGLEETYGPGRSSASTSSTSSAPFVNGSPQNRSSGSSNSTNSNSSNSGTDGLAPFSNMGMAGYAGMDLDSLSMDHLPMGMNMDMLSSLSGMSGMGMDALLQMLNQPQALPSTTITTGINPQLVDSPAPIVSMDDEDEEEAEAGQEEEEEGAGSDEDMADDTVVARKTPARRGRKKAADTAPSPISTSAPAGRRSTRKASSATSPSTTSPTSSLASNDERETRLTLTIAPVKVGGRGTTASGTGVGRKGTVMSGGVVKKGSGPQGALGVAGLASGVASSSSLPSSTSPSTMDKENDMQQTAPAKRGRKPANPTANAVAATTTTTKPVVAKGRPGRKPAVPKDVEDVSPMSPSTLGVVNASTIPIISTTSVAAPTTSPYSQLASTSSVTPTAASIPVHTRTPSTPNVATTPGPGIPHSSSGLGIVPPPLPNGQRNLTPVDLGIGRRFAFAIPMGTFNSGGSGFPGTAGGSGGNSSSAGKRQASGGFRAMSEFGDDEDDMGGMSMAGDEMGMGNVTLDADGNPTVPASLPADWRPSPEVFAKMSSKEKRQLRNKISARNFRVRRKEYISTLEGDIAERDRLLEAIRNELGSSRNENLALRQEVENLKRVLLNGRGVVVDESSGTSGQLIEGLELPPPAPLPEKSAAEVLAARASSSSPSQTSISSPSALIKPNTQKDLPNSPRIHPHTSPFWGGSGGAAGAGMFGHGGVTAVHTTFVPAPSVSLVGLGLGAGVGGGLQENMNPLMRTLGAGVNGGSDNNINPQMRRESAEERVDNFDGFADSNMFTMKNLDAYRMHLWGKMAAQYHHHQHQQQQHNNSNVNPYLAQQQHQQQLTGLASRLGRSWFQSTALSDSSSSSSPSSSSSSGSSPRTPFANFTNFSTAGGSGSGMGNGSYHQSPLLSAILSGKGSVGGGYSYSSASFKRHPPSSASSNPHSEKQGQQQQQVQKERQEQAQKQAQAAMLAAVASQTILKKMGNAFWDAFAGHGSDASSSGPPAKGLVKHFDTPSSSSSKSTTQPRLRPWDADKVKRVLEGKAVVRVVDVDQLYRLGGDDADFVPITPRRGVDAQASAAPSASSSSTLVPPTNMSKGGSMSVPSSPVLKPAPHPCTISAACSALEEKMKGLKL